MQNIILVVGRGGVGKDAVLRMVREYYKEKEKSNRELHSIVMNTTRPMRVGEVNGVDYNFIEKGDIEDENVLEIRKYNTVNGEWIYYTDKRAIEEEKDYIAVATPEVAISYINRVCTHKITVIYLIADDIEILDRGVKREGLQVKPNALEVCRRFIADKSDYEIMLGELREMEKVNGDKYVYEVRNDVLEECVLEVVKIINKINGGN